MFCALSDLNGFSCKGLELAIPQSLLTTTDEVIE
jgi:hypothetical protein